ncbi:kunitz-type protease inhibitor 2-like [Amphiprion ocellaris]|uniref:kunitz-type protease inhibitor 2-like n=1 Tax=Amphiprion ocellaris TaxID=80972 RepID=UPI002410D0DE|nr:kunitz-type protease inhibitor 2-like [Amphiprion ocellaris]
MNVLPLGLLLGSGLVLVLALDPGPTPYVVPLLDSEPRSNEASHVDCRLPMKVGPCRAAFPRFFYNPTNQSCSSFVYGGCESNRNNFLTLEECESSCSGVTGSVLPEDSTAALKAPRMAPSNPPESSSPQQTEMSAEEYAEHCEAELQVGPCRAAFRRWYYDREAGSCQSFIYGGCKGNKNNYVNEESCMVTCSVTVLPSSKKVSADDDGEALAAYKGHCLVSPDPGPCRAAFPMFYYNPDSASCQSFIYGGCRGNENRYGSVEECMDHCSGDGRFDGRGRTRNRWTAAFFLFVTLTVIALLLATLVIVTLRRHRLSRRPSSISDKEELLPDPDELSSLDSLTVPESPKPEQKA